MDTSVESTSKTAVATTESQTQHPDETLQTIVPTLVISSTTENHAANSDSELPTHHSTDVSKDVVSTVKSTRKLKHLLRHSLKPKFYRNLIRKSHSTSVLPASPSVSATNDGHSQVSSSAYHNTPTHKSPISRDFRSSESINTDAAITRPSDETAFHSSPELESGTSDNVICCMPHSESFRQTSATPSALANALMKPPKTGSLGRAQRQMSHLFPALRNEAEDIIGRYVCTLHHDGTWSGKLYICKDVACFYAKRLGKIKQVTFRYADVVNIEKEHRFNPFLGSIRIRMKEGESYLLGSTLKKDTILQLLKTTWEDYTKTHNSAQRPSIASSRTAVSTPSNETTSSHSVFSPSRHPSLIRKSITEESDGATEKNTTEMTATGQEQKYTDVSEQQQPCHYTDDFQLCCRPRTRRRKAISGLFHRHTISGPPTATNICEFEPGHLSRHIVAPATARTPESTSASEFTQSPKSSTSDTSQDEHGDLNKDKSVVLRNTSFNVASVNDVNPVAANIRPDVHACACSDHPKHLLLDVHLPLHASDVFHLIFGESQYVVRECDRGQLWRRNEHCQWTQRDVLYTRPFEAVRDSSSKRTPITLEHQRMRHYDEVNGVYAVDVWTRFAANQRDDQFVVYTRWCITETMDSQKHAPCTRLLLTCSVEFTRKFVIRENALERSAVDRMRVLVNIFFARLKGHLDHTLPSTLQTIRQLKHSSPIPEIVLSPLMKKKHHRHYHHKKNAKSAVAHTRSLGGQSWTGFNFRVFPSSLGELGGFLTKTTSFFSIILLCLLVFTTVWNAISIVQLHEQDVTHAASIPTLDSSFDATPTTTAKSSIVLSPNSLQKSMHTSEEVASSLDMDKSSDAFEAEKQDNNMQFCQSAELRKMLELYTEFERLKHRRALTPANNDETDTYSTVWMDIAEKLMSVSPTQFENVNDCIKLLKTRDERQSN